MTSETQKDYRTLLREELERRCQRNARYSLRSFARDMGIPAPQLSDILRARYGLSKNSALQIAKKLGWNEKERMLFSELVECKHARSARKREQAREKVQALHREQTASLTLDAFQFISEWYHYALLELTLVKDFRSDPGWIAARLGISQHVATAAIARLKRLDLLEDKDGRLRSKDSFTASPSGIPSEAIRKFHRQVLDKANAAVTMQTVEERELSAMILAIDKRQLPEAREWIKRFRRDFDAHFGAAQEKDEVYCLGVQFFRFQESLPSVSQKERSE